MNNQSEDVLFIRKLIFITLGIIAIAVGLYFYTTKVLNKKSYNNEVDFDYSVALVGTMFNRPYDNYYVFLYDSTSTEAATYENLIAKYQKNENSIKIYTVDLSQNLDKKYLNTTSNSNPTNPKEVKVNKSALVLIKNGKVVNYYENVNDYEKVLN